MKHGITIKNDFACQCVKKTGTGKVTKQELQWPQIFEKIFPQNVREIQITTKQI